MCSFFLLDKAKVLTFLQTTSTRSKMEQRKEIHTRRVLHFVLFFHIPSIYSGLPSYKRLIPRSNFFPTKIFLFPFGKDYLLLGTNTENYFSQEIVL